MKNFATKLKELFQNEVYRFLLIGGSSFLLFYALNNSILFILKFPFDNPNKITRAIIVSSAYLISYFLAFIYNFSFSKNWTFKSKNKEAIKKESMKFFIVNTFNAIAGSLFTTILDYFGIPPYISLIIFTSAQTIWTYFLYKLWVFGVQK